ncbi:hypothetical protein DFH11DRAFT_1621971 [Phellopilus nigrolimitatus]|nr:hypothetical protein DFH11DRAFT_1621971 [Phellopilus nigrolimitatus]
MACATVRSAMSSQHLHDYRSFWQVLALTMEPASPALLNRKPGKKTAPLFNVDMYKYIFGQSVYQTIVILDAP